MSDTWQDINQRKPNYCERVSKCSNRNCDNKGNALFAVLGDDGKEYCSEICADEEKIEEITYE